MRYFKLIDTISGLDFKPGRIFGMNDNNMVYTSKDNKCEFINAAILYGDKFKEIVPRFKERDSVKVIQGGKDKYGKVISVDPYSETMEILLDDLKTILHQSAASCLVIRVTPYWFINSEGKYCKAIEEKTDSRVLNYRKSVGNYFKTKEEAAKGEIYTKFDNDKFLIAKIELMLQNAKRERRQLVPLKLPTGYWDGVIYTCEQLLKDLDHE